MRCAIDEMALTGIGPAARLAGSRTSHRVPLARVVVGRRREHSQGAEQR
jgi:hypothetical protein